MKNTVCENLAHEVGKLAMEEGENWRLEHAELMDAYQAYVGDQTIVDRASCDIRVRLRFEGREVLDGVNISESMLNYYVAIRRNNCIMWIRIPKDDPKSYSVTVETENEWDQKLWS